MRGDKFRISVIARTDDETEVSVLMKSQGSFTENIGRLFVRFYKSNSKVCL